MHLNLLIFNSKYIGFDVLMIINHLNQNVGGPNLGREEQGEQTNIAKRMRY